VRQSAVSRRVQAFENELGVSLFERQLTGVRLTVAGEHCFDRTRAAFAEIDHAVTNAMAAGRGADPAVAMEFFEGPAPDQIARIMVRRLDVAFLVDGTWLTMRCVLRNAVRSPSPLHQVGGERMCTFRCKG